jgi:hypothetical protein
LKAPGISRFKKTLMGVTVVMTLATVAPVNATPIGGTGGTTGRSAYSPGGLDARGGHHCWTSCSKYGKYYGQYHCHRAPCGRRDIRKHRRHGH